MIIRSVYISGQMTGRSMREVREEREKVVRLITAIGIKVLDPLRGKDVSDDAMLNAQGNGTMPTTSLVERDLTDVTQTDATIVLTGDGISFGTTFEWSWARSHGKPVFVVATKSPDELGAFKIHNCTGIFPSIEALRDHLRTWVDPSMIRR